MFENAKFEKGATKETAQRIINKISNDLGYREKEILKNITSIEKNSGVPAGYIQYIFYDIDGNGFQAGKYPNGSYGISI